MKFDDYACLRLIYDPNDPRIDWIIEERCKEMCEDWEQIVYSRSRLREEFEDIARMRFLVTITSEYVGIMTKKGMDAAKLWHAFSKAVQRDLELYMSDIG